MSSVNKVIIVGRLGKDPESRTLPDGRAVTNFSLATSERWKDKSTGDQREKTEWHNCDSFGRVAEIIAQYSKKGDLLYVEGSLTTQKWQDKEGKDRYTTKVRVHTVQFLTSKNSGQPADATDDDKNF
jgi:single-strand DNA-binding protein